MNQSVVSDGASRFDRSRETRERLRQLYDSYVCERECATRDESFIIRELSKLLAFLRYRRDRKRVLASSESLY